MLPKITLQGCLLALGALLIICGVNLASDYGTMLKLKMRTTESNTIAKSSADAFASLALGEHSDVIYAGRPFFLHNSYRRSETCYFHVAITMNGIDNNVSVALRDVTNWLSSGDYEFNDLLDVPLATPAGDYVIRKKLVNFCGKDTYYTNLFDLRVKVASQP